ncbi:beta-ketoacyl-ACP synthase II [Wohlfahrtiimonas chitiniclastica]|uniref:beta-ketoacyl-ACP synthase n=1 Tax=Wohlfahrtiimonas chitiniclastica TaxID=400946 RepID=UPI000B99748E|nr:beta-ketoacyl-ACP synthase [Wohlfahrtiimonas chitiniclastica]OYQ70616.1 beta-ketoacyl-ACP synthase II [Wohlfahrtiimonas chitiniclastica]OYQ82101.1 beta-ketoacyl-ACP synthase II [Wohlfahrtiimonas chitiniclastica]OYQ83821.1 beta-ketoacyl-ACP synthase II [Wohlfahrtiimonas chitiniclastica]OYQ84660.1 beta-ketoacyl-ACP synthase II [Wohlfahrtiimonas chitiniclastica]
MKRVVVTGMGGISALGQSWAEINQGLQRYENTTRYMPQWEIFQGLHAKIAAPITNFTQPAHYPRKKIRSMSRVSILATAATEHALAMAGLLEDPILTSGECGIAYGSSTGGTGAVAELGKLITEHSVYNINATTYVKMMPHTAAVNVGLFFGLRGRVIPTSSACTSGSQAIGYAYEAIAMGQQTVMVAGGGEELCPSEVAVFDVLYATSTHNQTPQLTPKPFDATRDGLVIGEGAGTLILEEYEHAKARGATIYAEIVGFATNCDATHVTEPNKETMEICIAKALDHAGIAASNIGYISAHGTATTKGDIAETQATFHVHQPATPISSFKSYVGHTLGACGALEAWAAIEMMNQEWFHPTLNLTTPDPLCGDLDYIQGEGRTIATEFVQSNNFAFGGINTSLVFKRTL